MTQSFRPTSVRTSMGVGPWKSAWVRHQDWATC